MRSTSALFPLFVSASLARTLSLLGPRGSVIDPAGGSGSPDLVSNLLGGPHMLPRRTSPSSNKHDHGHRHRHSHNGKPKPIPAVPPAEPVSKHHVNPSPLSQLLSGEPQNEKRVVHGFGLAMGKMKRKDRWFGRYHHAPYDLPRRYLGKLRCSAGFFVSNLAKHPLFPLTFSKLASQGRFIDFQTSVNLFSTTLHSLGDDKGLANYDRSDELETLIKDVVNAVKDTLNSVDSLVFSVPLLGSTLGPVVYSLKCTLDDTLNATENLLDGVMNLAGIHCVNGLLNPLIAVTIDLVCQLIALKGLCVV
ncbi:hypothetical protein BS47DRAFT_1396973 [Hydnum rufescens UP504]|uniref:Uncharacterized protein n=1 Tax=Hydnum rufescens UP504 TaxID=1448309 RepID=A0A9P6APM1_9AGAM|nr:hypothetical protein BS47DRAFT_1396973 [Hydnum rufescens UP504]